MAFRIVLTDLDGTLLDGETYSWDRARPALDRLRSENIPCIFVTSKTSAEVEFWRREMGNTHPFIVENGGALLIPDNYFAFAIPNSVRRDHATLVEWGTPYAILVQALRRAADHTNCQVRGFSEMGVTEVARLCNLAPEQACLAKMRGYDEPFIVLDLTRADALKAAITADGLNWTSGGRFHHITGANDKGHAVHALLQLYSQIYGDIISIGLGDSFNDISLLESVSLPILMPSAHVSEMVQAVPGVVIAERAGPDGWNRAVLDFISKEVDR